MDFSRLTDQERMVAEQAVTTYRALEKAASAAPMGQGLATLENIIHDKGFEHLRNMLQTASASRSEAQKKEPVSGRVPVAGGANSSR
jgi:hypothetical protein